MSGLPGQEPDLLQPQAYGTARAAAVVIPVNRSKIFRKQNDQGGAQAEDKARPETRQPAHVSFLPVRREDLPPAERHFLQVP
jgi:hypothetical protein